MPDCAEKKGIKYCFECKEFPCPRHYGEENNLTIFDKKWLDFIKKEVKG
ncbi:MAG: DUF3795 domain-containing protein [Thermoplasmatales archaeon]|nr:DUF3795 domain-containing protein [Thermoplasmatales archaeon]